MIPIREHHHESEELEVEASSGHNRKAEKEDHSAVRKTDPNIRGVIEFHEYNWDKKQPEPGGFTHVFFDSLA